MTTRPRLRSASGLLPGVIAFALFVFLALIAVRATFGDAAGFPADAEVTRTLAYAYLDFTGDWMDADAYRGETLAVALIAVALVLDAVLGAAVMLASRDVEDGVVTAVGWPGDSGPGGDRP